MDEVTTNRPASRRQSCLGHPVPGDLPSRSSTISLKVEEPRSSVTVGALQYSALECGRVRHICFRSRVPGLRHQLLPPRATATATSHSPRQGEVQATARSGDRADMVRADRDGHPADGLWYRRPNSAPRGRGSWPSSARRSQASCQGASSCTCSPLGRVTTCS